MFDTFKFRIQYEDRTCLFHIFNDPQSFTVCVSCLLPSPAVVMVCLLRYAQLIEHSHRCWVNTSALVSGCTNAVGLVMVGNFQVSVLHDPTLLKMYASCRDVQTSSPTLLFVRLITPSLSTTWEPGWRSQQGCCLCACSVFSPTGWL